MKAFDFFREAVLHQFVKRGLKLTRLTDKEKVLGLIKRLRPYQTQFDLIRFGGPADGGYLLPNDLNGIAACFSPGVSTTSEFELDCLNYGMQVFMADKSVDKPNWNIPENRYHFLKKFIGCMDNEDFITMESWVSAANIAPASDLLLQMDIEGSEYAAFLNMPEELISRFRIMVIEFHHFDFIWQPYLFEFAESVMMKLLKNHVCVHIHPNNSSGANSTLGIEIPRALEFTFLRKDRVKAQSLQLQFPHELDYDNTKDRHISLPGVWYKN